VLCARLASLRSVMSTITPSVWIGRPSSSRTIVSRSQTHLTEPSAAIMRYSRSNSI
jgi:hypothetical protein